MDTLEKQLKEFPKRYLDEKICADYEINAGDPVGVIQDYNKPKISFEEVGEFSESEGYLSFTWPRAINLSGNKFAICHRHYDSFVGRVRIGELNSDNTISWLTDYIQYHIGDHVVDQNHMFHVEDDKFVILYTHATGGGGPYDDRNIYFKMGEYNGAGGIDWIIDATEIVPGTEDVTWCTGENLGESTDLTEWKPNSGAYRFVAAWRASGAAGEGTAAYGEITPGRREKSIVTASSDVDGALNGKYFTFSSPSEDYYVWYSNTDIRYCNFENNLEDQRGYPWWYQNAATGVHEFSTNSKFGTYSVGPSTNPITPSRIGNQPASGFTNFVRGESQGMFFWMYPTSENHTEWGFATHQYNSNDGFGLSEINRTVKLGCNKNAVGTTITSSEQLTLNTWNFVGFTYDATTDTAYLIVNSTVNSQVLGGAWGVGADASFYYLLLRTGLGLEYYADDFLLAMNNYVSPAQASAYFTSGQNWATHGYPSQDPALPAKTAIKVDFITNLDTFSLGDDTTKKIQDTLDDFYCWSGGAGDINIENREHGAVTHVADGGTGWTFAISEVGDTAYRIEMLTDPTAAAAHFNAASTLNPTITPVGADRFAVSYVDDAANATHIRVGSYVGTTDISWATNEVQIWNAESRRGIATTRIFSDIDTQILTMCSINLDASVPVIVMNEIYDTGIFATTRYIQYRSPTVNLNAEYPDIISIDQDKFMIAYYGIVDTTTPTYKVFLRIGKIYRNYHAGHAQDSYVQWIWPEYIDWPIEREEFPVSDEELTLTSNVEISILRFSEDRYAVFYQHHSATEGRNLIKVFQYNEEGIGSDNVDEYEITGKVVATSDTLTVGNGADHTLSNYIEVNGSGNNMWTATWKHTNTWQYIQDFQIRQDGTLMRRSNQATTGTINMGFGEQVYAEEGISVHAYRHSNANIYYSVGEITNDPTVAHRFDINQANAGFGATEGKPSASRLNGRQFAIVGADSSTNSVHVRGFEFYGDALLPKSSIATLEDGHVLDITEQAQVGETGSSLGRPVCVQGMDNSTFMVVYGASDFTTAPGGHGSCAKIRFGRVTAGTVEWLTKLKYLGNVPPGNFGYETEGITAIESTYLGDNTIALIYSRKQSWWDKTSEFLTIPGPSYLQIIQWDEENREIVYPTARIDLTGNYMSRFNSITHIENGMFAVAYMKQGFILGDLVDDNRFQQRYYRIGKYETGSVTWITNETQFGPSVTDDNSSYTIQGLSIAAQNNYLLLAYRDENDSGYGKIQAVELEKKLISSKDTSLHVSKSQIEWLTDDIPASHTYGVAWAVCRLTDTRFAMGWRDDAQGQYLYARVGEYTNGKIIWLTDKTKINAYNIESWIYFERLTDNRWVSTNYRQDNTDGYAQVLEYENGAIHQVTSKTYFSTYAPYTNSMRLDDNSWITTYHFSDADQRARAMYYNEDNANITFMSGEIEIGAGYNGTYNRPVQLKDPKNFAVVCRHDSPYYGYVHVSRWLANNDTTSSADGSFTRLTGVYQYNDSSRADWNDITHLGENVFVISWQDQGRGLQPTIRIAQYNDDWTGGVGSGTITFLTARIQLDATGDDSYFNRVESLGGGKFAVVWRLADGENSMYIKICQWKNGALSYLTDNLKLNHDYTDYMEVTNLGNGLFIVTSTGHSDDQASVRVRVGKLPQFYGIAENSGTFGDIIKVRTVGVNNDQDNLVTGSNYYVDYNDGLIKTTGADLVGTAISKFDLQIKRDDDEFRGAP